MKRQKTKSEVLEQIEKFFDGRDFSPEEMKKIKRISMKYRISLRDKKKNFCKKCFSKLRGKTRVSKGFKNVECANCNFLNRVSIRRS